MPLTHEEFQTRLSIMRALLDKHGVDGLLLRRVSSFAWATGGAASYINTAATEGAATLVITREAMYLATNNIEAPRLQDEEHLAEQGWEFVISPWQTPMQGLQTLIAGKSLVTDVPFPNAKDISPEIARLRASLTPEEGERFRQLGILCAETITAAAQAIQPGMSEFELAALLGGESQKRGIQPIVNLIATDERAYRYRHPLPTIKKLGKYALLVLSGRQRGLVCSVSRLVHFGKPPAELERCICAAAQVNAAFITHSRPGSTLRDIFARGQAAYAKIGYPDEWQHHHQGGVTGYEPREYIATSEAADVLSIGQALAWNPTVAGAKIEDTILLGPKTNEILTFTTLWPVEQVEIPG
ncbi:MAG: M24 family metallopeptidase, partial [Anaerolineales bacterium]|nr:M24 family metallopeptidase [Anaerolineales bacterium]